MKRVAVSLIIVFALGAIVWGLNAFGLVTFRFFAPKYENARREVFEETKSYVHGMVQDLGKYMYEWQTGDKETRLAIEAVIRVRYANFPASKVKDPALRAFLQKCRGF